MFVGHGNSKYIRMGNPSSFLPRLSRYGLAFFTFYTHLASVLASFENYGHGHITSRNSLHPSAESRRGFLDSGSASALEYISPSAIHGRTRFRSKIEVDAFYDACADCRRHTSPGQPGLSVRRSL